MFQQSRKGITWLPWLPWFLSGRETTSNDGWTTAREPTMGTSLETGPRAVMLYWCDVQIQWIDKKKNDGADAHKIAVAWTCGFALYVCTGRESFSLRTARRRPYRVRYRYGEQLHCGLDSHYFSTQQIGFCFLNNNFIMMIALSSLISVGR